MVIEFNIPVRVGIAVLADRLANGLKNWQIHLERLKNGVKRPKIRISCTKIQKRMVWFTF